MKTTFRLSLLLLAIGEMNLALSGIRYALANRWRPAIYQREIAQAKLCAARARSWFRQVWAIV